MYPVLDVPGSPNRVPSGRFYLQMDFNISRGYRQLITVQRFRKISFMESNDTCFGHRVIDQPGADIISRFGQIKVKE